MRTFQDIWADKRSAFEGSLHDVTALDLIGEWAWEICKQEYETKIRLAISQLEYVQELYKKEGLDNSIVISMLKQ